MKMLPRALSGIKPTGMPHLGNYLGMIKPALKLQETHETFYFIADYHALTTQPDPQKLRSHTYDLVATFVALGMDIEKHTLFKQSDIPEVTELTWLLSCVTPKGLLERAHAYKDAIAKNIDANHGLFSYPALMAADILIYDSDYVPVGKDQKQHLEITRDIASRFNHIYGDTLVIPEPVIAPEVATIPGLDGQKMSKSYNNTIPLFLPEKKLRKLIMKIVTDSKSVDDPKDPNTCNVFSLFKFFATPEEHLLLSNQYQAGGLGYGEAKQICFEVINRELKTARNTYFSIRSDEEKLNQILRQGCNKAKKIAQEVLDRTRMKVGL